MIELYLLEQLKAFSEKQTLSAAADELHISQPALSRSMQKLEEKIGIPLFERQRNHLTLNDNGRLLAKYGTELLKQEEEMEKKVVAYDRSKHAVHIGSDAPGPLYIYPGLLKKAYPDMEISSDMQTDAFLLRGLQDRVYQIIVLNHNVQNADMYCHLGLTEHLFMTVLPANPASAYALKGLNFADVNGQSFLELSSVGVWHDIVQKKMPDSKLLVQTQEDALGEIIHASGIAAFATDISLSAASHHRNSHRIAVPFNDPEAAQQFYLICLKENRERYDAFFQANDHYLKTRKRIR